MKIRFEELEVEKRAGGIEIVTKELAEHLFQSGITVSRSSESASGDAEAGCVHIHGIWSLRLAKVLMRAQRRGLPCVVSAHGMLQPWALRHKRIKKMIAWSAYQKRLLEQASVLHASSALEAEHLQKLGLRAKIALIPWGVTLPAEPIRDRHFASAGKNGARTALFVGRIFPVKGLPLLIEAWAKVRPRGWKMKIVGPDEAGHLGEVRTMIRNRGLQSDFEICGELQGAEKEAALRNADLFILPSHTENFGMVVAEAMAHGLPVITTQGTPWRELPEEGCGWWVPVSVEGVATALTEATGRSSEELAVMGQRGKSLVMRNYSWTAVTEQFVELYRWAIEGGDLPKSVVV